MTILNGAFAELQSRWPNLCDLDRAQAIHSMQQEGMSLRELARHLKCSPSLLSYLLKVAQAPAEDCARARRGEISTRALARIARTSGTRSTVQRHEAIEFERERAAFQASKSVLAWFADEEIAESNRVQVIEEARSHLDQAQEWKEAFLGNRLDQVVQEFRNVEGELTGNRPAAWFSLRLALWALRRIPDDRVRDRALEIVHGDKANS